MLGEEGARLAAGNQGAVDAAARLVPDRLEAGPNGLVLHKQLGHGRAHHDHDAGPKEPVPRRRSPLAELAERREGVIAIPLGVVGDLEANALSVVHQRRADDAPGDHGTGEHGNGRVQADQDARANKGRGPFKVPAPRLDVHGPAGVATPDVNPGEEVPVVEDTNGVV